MNSVSRQLADLMLDLETFQCRPAEPVRWASGHLMPVYNDNRRLLSHPKARELVARGFAAMISAGGIEADGVVGTASGGIAPATTLADRLGVRLYYVRPAAKKHGLERQVEGLDPDQNGDRVVIVEDLVSTGMSSLRAVRAVHAAGLCPVRGMSVFSYGFAAAEKQFELLPFPFEMNALVTAGLLLERAEARGSLTDDELTHMRRWLADPFTWAEQQGFAS